MYLYIQYLQGAETEQARNRAAYFRQFAAHLAVPVTGELGCGRMKSFADSSAVGVHWEQVDRYLQYLDYLNIYTTLSTGLGDALPLQAGHLPDSLQVVICLQTISTIFTLPAISIISTISTHPAISITSTISTARWWPETTCAVCETSSNWISSLD